MGEGAVYRFIPLSVSNGENAHNIFMKKHKKVLHLPVNCVIVNAIRKQFATSVISDSLMDLFFMSDEKSMKICSSGFSPFTQNSQEEERE